MSIRIEKKPFFAEVPAGQTACGSVPLGISGDSTVSPSTVPSEGIWADITRPFCPVPAKELPFMLELLKIEEKVSKTLEKEGNQLEREIKSDLKRLEAFNAEKIKMLHEHAEVLESQANWSSWLAVTEYLGYSASIALGAACFASGAGVAPALFFATSGLIGMVNRIGGDSGAWRWAASFITKSHEKQVKVEQIFTNTLAAASIALALAGAWNAYHICLDEKLLNEAVGRVTFLFEMAVGGAQSALRAGEGYHAYNSSKIQIALKLSAEKTLNLQTEISMNTAEIQKQFDLSKELDKVIKSALAAQQQWP